MKAAASSSIEPEKGEELPMRAALFVKKPALGRLLDGELCQVLTLGDRAVIAGTLARKAAWRRTECMDAVCIAGDPAQTGDHMAGEQVTQVPEEDEDDEALTEGERVRRVALLTRHCIDNIACYRAGWATDSDGERHVLVQRNFWIRANGNFLDIAVSEWCKVFADRKSKHHFARVMPEPAKVLAELTAAVGMDEAAYGALIGGVREYRDKFVAHLDDQRVMNVPAMQPLLDSAVFLYDALCTNEATLVHLTGLQPDAGEFYDQRFSEALAEYRRAES